MKLFDKRLLIILTFFAVYVFAESVNQESDVLQRLSYWLEQAKIGEKWYDDEEIFTIGDSINAILNSISRAKSRDAIRLILKYTNQGAHFVNCISLVTLWYLMSAENVSYGDVELGNEIISIIKNYKNITLKVHFLPSKDSDVGDDKEDLMNRYYNSLKFLYYLLGRSIRKIYGRDCIPILLQLAQDTNLPEDLRANYCEFVADLHNKDSFEKILEIAQTFSDPKNLINVLCATSDERALPHILKYVDSYERELAYGLMYIPSPVSIQTLIKILEHQIAIGAECTGKALWGTAYDNSILSLGVIGDESAIPVLKKALADSNQIQARRLSAWSLWMLEDKSGIPVMVKDRHFTDLEIMADPFAVPYLIPLLEDKDEEVRLATIEVLQKIGTHDVIAPLLKHYDEPKESKAVKDRIAIALAYLGENRVIPRLVSILSDTLKENLWPSVLNALMNTDGDEKLKPVLYELLNNESHNILAAMNLVNMNDTMGLSIKVLGESPSKFIVRKWSSDPEFFRRIKKHFHPSPEDFIDVLKDCYNNEYNGLKVIQAIPEFLSYKDISALESKIKNLELPPRIKIVYYLTLASLCQSAKDYNKEGKFAKLALENARKIKDYPLILESLWMLSDALVFSSKYDESEKLLRDALEICGHLSQEERSKSREMFPDAYTYCLLGELNLKRKNYKEAFKNFTNARNELNYRVSTLLATFMRQREPRDRLKARVASGLGVTHTELGKASFKEAVEGFDKVGTTNIREQESRDRAYYGLIRAAVADGDYEEAQKLTEKLILIKLNEDFEKLEVNPVNPEKKKEMEELKKRKNEIEEMKREIEKEKKQGETVDTLIQKKTREFKKYIHNLKTNNPKLFTIVNSEPSNLKELQDMGIIPDDMAILQYLIGEEELYIFVVKSDDLLIKKVVVSQTKIAGLIDGYRALIKNLGSEEDLDEYANELYKYLIEPLESDLSGINTIGVIPNQQLYYLPFSALKKKKDKVYFGEKYQIFYANSTSILGIVAQQKGCDIADAQLVAFANADGTLPEAETEVKNISNLYPESWTLYQDKATKDSVFKTSGCQILQFATHGKAVSYAPTSSYLVLAPKGEQGQLRVEEIWGLDLKNCPLVVLSACETAEGKLIAGDEVVSLAFGFIYAGSASCVATLWEVASQSTADLMQEFHKNLKSGKSRIQSLQEAQMSLLKNPKTVHPFFWAPFVLIGDWR